MTTHTMRRWGAVLITGGVLTAIGYVLFPSTARSPLIQPAAALVLVGVLLLVPGLIAFQVAQSGRARVNGWIGAGLLGGGVLLLEVPHCVLALVNLDYMKDLDAYHASFFGQAEFPAIICIAVGQIVLASAIWRSATYPRWATGLLVLNIVVTISSFLPGVSALIKIPAPNYLLFGLLGAAMLALAGRRETTAAPRTATPAVA